MEAKTSGPALDVAIYTRVSTSEQEVEGLSLENQEERCRQKVESLFRGKKLEFTVYSDPGHSGSLWYRREGDKRRKYRPGLTKLVEAIDAGKHQCLVAYRGDRLARSLQLSLDLIHVHIIPNNLELVYVNGPERPLSSDGMLTSNLLASVAEHVRSMASDNVKDVLRYRRDHGYTVGDVPYGWKWADKELSQGTGIKNILPVLEQGQHIVRMAEWFLNGRTYQSIADELARMGVKSPSGKAKWCIDVVKRVILHPAHTGLIVSSSGELIQAQHYEYRYYDPDHHQRIVDEYEKRKPVGPRTRSDEVYILLPKITCAACGDRLYIDRRRDSPYRVYSCRNHTLKRGRTCTGVRARTVWVEGAALTAIHGLCGDERITYEAEKTITELCSASSSVLKQDKARLEMLQREDTEKLASATEKYVDGKLSDESFHAFEHSLSERLADRQRQLDSIAVQLRGNDRQTWQIEETKRILRDFPTIWDALEMGEKRQIIDHLFESITLEQNQRGAQLTLKPRFAPAMHITIPAGKRRTGSGPGDPWHLSDREVSILRDISEGMSSKEIAEDLGIDIQTVWNGHTRIRQMLGVDDMKVAVEMARPVIEERAHFLPRGSRLANARDIPEDPTPNQFSVLQRIAKGMTVSEAARDLGITPNTASARLRVLRNKLGLKDIAQLLTCAADRGWAQSIQKPRELCNTPLLTQKEMEVYRARQVHGSVTKTAEALCLCRNTVASRCTTIRQKLGVKTWEEVEGKVKHSSGLDGTATA